jgi:hypothetical protein
VISYCNVELSAERKVRKLCPCRPDLADQDGRG